MEPLPAPLEEAPVRLPGEPEGLRRVPPHRIAPVRVRAVHALRGRVVCAGAQVVGPLPLVQRRLIRAREELAWPGLG